MIKASDISYQTKFSNVSFKDIVDIGVEYYEIFYRSKWYSVYRYKDEVRAFPYDGDNNRIKAGLSFFIKEMYAKFYILRNIDVKVIRDTDFCDILSEYIIRRMFVVPDPHTLPKLKNVIMYLEEKLLKVSDGNNKPMEFNFTLDDIISYGEKYDKKLADQGLVRDALLNSILFFKYNIERNKKSFIDKLNLQVYTATKTKVVTINNKSHTIRGKMYKVDHLIANGKV